MHHLSYRIIKQDSSSSSSSDEDDTSSGTGSFHTASDQSNLVSTVLTGLHDVVEAVEDEISTAVESSSENEAMAKLSIEERAKNSFCTQWFGYLVEQFRKVAEQCEAKDYCHFPAFGMDGCEECCQLNGYANTISVYFTVTIAVLGEGIVHWVDSTLDILPPEEMAKRNTVSSVV
uniref:Uncharacterized protein n=1 Tax=Ditylenchus dipsaci TaxID=166011 RepID=A0A915EEM7_9BILA